MTELDPDEDETPHEAANARAEIALVLSVLSTLAIYKLPFASTIGWPLVLLSTLAHELGHGIAAILVGGRFESLLISPDASGIAHCMASGPISNALVAAGGLVGPACAAALLFVLARSDRLARVGLVVLGLALAPCVPLLLEGSYGKVFVSAVALVLCGLGVKAPAWLARLSLAFVAVQLSLSVYSRGDYLFTPVARMMTGDMPSDVAHMSQYFGLPYWFWGGVCGLFSIVVLLVGARLFLRGFGWRAEPAKKPEKVETGEKSEKGATNAEPVKLDPLAEIERIVKGRPSSERERERGC